MAILARLGSEPSRADLDAARSSVEALLAHAPNDGGAHYAHGVLMSALDAPPGEVLAEYQRAFELDPQFALAAYNAGVVQSGLGDEEAALAWLTRAVVIDPTLADAQYNAGQIAYNLGRYDLALDAFLCARALAPEPFVETKKVVQALHALGRFADARAAREEMWRLHAASSDPRVRALRDVVIDQARIEDRLVMISETDPTSREADLAYVYIARAYDGHQVVEQAQVETSAVIAENGFAAILCYERGGAHFTTLIAFRSMPSYEQARPALLDLIGRLLHGERVPTGASSRPR